MITGIFHQGSGLGNQLHRYVMTRVLALDKGLKWGMQNPHLFKGYFFKDFDYGDIVEHIENTYEEKKVLNVDGNDVRDYDWEGILTIKDNTSIDGEFQGEKYYEHHLDKIDTWLKVDPLDSPDDLCIIGFRGGEYVGVPGLFLPKSYWETAISMMREINPDMRFEVHTDDVITAQNFFPDFVCIHDMELNWRAVRYAKYLIIANSSFFILPSLLSNAQKIIAPLYWAGRNKGYWQLEQNKYKKFTYI